MLIHPDRPFRDAHERQSERTLAATRHQRLTAPARPIASSNRWGDLLASLRRSAAALF